MTRLAIIDLSDAAHQPMSNNDQTVWIVYNGEVYNFQDERRDLEARGYKFVSSSDTEVVLRLYEHYGDNFLLRLRGMFALAIYDKRRGSKRERLLLARDQLGIKPLLFARAGERLIFASELKALLCSGLISPEIDPVSLKMLLTYGSVYQPRTMISGVNMLLPAHRLVIDSGGEHLECYWRFGLDRCSRLRTRPYDDLVSEVAEGLKESAKLHMVSDVPLGAFLSGGVDSTLLVGLMTGIAGRRIKTFSVGFENEGALIDESNEAEVSAGLLGSDHTRVIVRGTDVRNRIKHIARSLDQPSVDGVNSYFISMAARRTVTVAISGTGGDEVFAGYPWFTQMALYQRQLEKEPWKFLATSLLGKFSRLSAFDPLLSRTWGNVFERLLSHSDFVGHYASNYLIFGVSGTTRLLAPELRMRAQAGRALQRDLSSNDELRNGAAFERASALCIRGYTSNQLLRDIDAVSMAHSLEVRVPFLDVPLIDLALSLPVSAKLGDMSQTISPHQATYRESGSKKILIDAGRELGILPRNIDHQPKRGFSMPFGPWLRGPLKEVLEDTLSENQVRQRGVFHVKEAVGIRDSFLAGQIDWPKPWLLMMIELWWRMLLDG
jgi:asparagine synthase (glutamine-hydrolysing)